VVARKRKGVWQADSQSPCFELRLLLVKQMAAAITLVTFDIDGTLVQSLANEMHRAAFSDAMRVVCGIDTHIDRVPHQGSTDALILLELQLIHGIERDRAMSNLPALKTAMIASARERAGAVGVELLPGVPDALRALAAEEDVLIGLVTGNLSEIAWLKMDFVGLSGFFSEPRFGGFGSDYCGGEATDAGRAADRTQLIHIARQRAEKIVGARGACIAKCFHVGDTPSDITAGESLGIAIGVCTGKFGRDQLESTCRKAESVVLDNLTDTAALLRFLRSEH
jgi:phosphoglycolate phosphatase-like HAD superfamily hydrolase